MKKLKDQDVYVHVVCALWFPEVTIADMATFKGVTWHEIDCRKWQSDCYLCGFDNYEAIVGACVSCDAGGCKRMFHATCGHRFDLLECDDSGELADPHFVFCKEHSSRMEPKVRDCWHAVP